MIARALQCFCSEYREVANQGVSRSSLVCHTVTVSYDESRDRTNGVRVRGPLPCRESSLLHPMRCIGGTHDNTQYSKLHTAPVPPPRPDTPRGTLRSVYTSLRSSARSTTSPRCPATAPRPQRNRRAAPRPPLLSTMSLLNIISDRHGSWTRTLDLVACLYLHHTSVR